MKLPPTFFSNFFQLFLHFKQYLWWITPPRFVQHFIGFLFIEEAVQSVAWVSGKVLINCPPPPFQIFREVVKNCMGFCCFVTIKDLPLGFLLSQQFYWHSPPPGGFGGAEPPNLSTPFFLVRLAAAAKPKSCFDGVENRAASSLGIGGHR